MDAVTTYYLEMNCLDDLKEKPQPDGFIIREAVDAGFELNKSLYQTVGGPWRWVDKLEWSDAEWKEYVSNPCVRIWVAYVNDAVAGYYELIFEPSGDVEIVYFGLTPEFLGRHLGGYLLTSAVKTAWSEPSTRRVWVHTCTLDHPAALQNYMSRGFKVYKEETEQ